MAALPNQTNINSTTPFFALAGSGGGGGGGIPLSISTNHITVSTISSLFTYTGVSSSVFQPIFYDQLGPIGSQMPAMELKLRQRALDAGAVVSLTMGTDFKRGTAYINSAWDGYIPMPLEMGIQDLTIKDETGTCMYVNNQVTQVPQLSTVSLAANSIKAANATANLPALFSTLQSLYPSNFS